MLGESPVQAFGLAAARRVASSVVAVGFLIALILSAGQAQACPPRTKADASAAIAYTTKPVVLSASAVQPGQIKTHAACVSPGHHCSGVPHSTAPGCQVGCCFTCSAVMDTSTSVLECPSVSTNYGLAAQRGILSKKISPLFRPPKSLALAGAAIRRR